MAVHVTQNWNTIYSSLIIMYRKLLKLGPGLGK